MNAMIPEAEFEVTADNLIREFPKVFDGQICVMDSEKFCIHLNEDAKPFCISASRTISFAFHGKVKNELDAYQSQGIIELVTKPTKWCAPIVVTPKKNLDDNRICVHFSRLNKFVKRELYSTCTPSDAVADIRTQHSEVFTVFDALKGYHQCPLDNQSQLLTTFMMPFDCFKFLRAPFGLRSTSKHYNRRFKAYPTIRKLLMTSIFLMIMRPIMWLICVSFCKGADKGIFLHRDKSKFCKKMSLLLVTSCHLKVIKLMICF